MHLSHICRGQIELYADTVFILAVYFALLSLEIFLLKQYDENNQKALLRRGLAFEGLERFQLGLTDIRKLLLANPNVAMANKAQHRLQNALRQQRKIVTS